MKTMSASDFKKNFSALIKRMTTGETIAVTDDKTKSIVGYFTFELSTRPQIKLGILEGKEKFTFSPDWEMNEEEFLGLDDEKN
ncbi:MAG TPA: prevent-host-death protein [Mucilaginibacter sp.]|jgi:hypothetical protein|nr:prevent-host-death protein [Mucilaginibacter sp.]